MIHLRALSIGLVASLLPACAATEPEDVGETAGGLTRAIDPARELVITDPSVLAGPEAQFDPSRPAGVTAPGAWSFGRLIHNMLPHDRRGSAADASRLVMDWLHTWEVDQAPNPAVSPARARSAIRLLITDPWKAASGCADPASPATDATCVLDMAQAPFQLVAIVNRPDLRVVANDDTATGGEGRFVFQVVGPTLGVDVVTRVATIMDPTPRPQKFTVIFEYALPARTAQQTRSWAQRWHALGARAFGPGFNAQLRAITSDFSGPDRAPGRPNGNALNQLRTNEVALMGARFPAAGFVAARQVWELREFRLFATGLAPHTVNLEPPRDLDVTKIGQLAPEGTRAAELGTFLASNTDAVLASRYALPPGLSGNSALVGSSPYGAWGKLVNPNPPAVPSSGVAHELPGVSIPVRDAFALGTCAGCHRHETDTRHFMHITALGAMEPADRVDDRARVGVAPGTPESATILSNFLIGEVSPGGPRYEDFAQVLDTPAAALAGRAGLRVCAE